MKHSRDDVALEADLAEARATNLLTAADKLMILQASRPSDKRICRLWLRLRLRGEELRPLYEYFQHGSEMELVDLHRRHIPVRGETPEHIGDPRAGNVPADGAILHLFRAESPHADVDEDTRVILDALEGREEMATALMWIRLRALGQHLDPLSSYLDDRRYAHGLRHAYRFNLSVAPFLRRAYRVKHFSHLQRIFERHPAPE